MTRSATKADEVRNFRIDQVPAAEVFDKSFPRQESFSIMDYAPGSFGVWQNLEQYDELIWRFPPGAPNALRASAFIPGKYSRRKATAALSCVSRRQTGWK